MEGMIVLSQPIAATNADILQGTRLQTVPAGGYLTFELQANLANATNNYAVSIQLPDGSTPMNGVTVPGATADIIDDRQKLMASFAIAQGGHCVFGLTETGTALALWRVTYTPG